MVRKVVIERVTVIKFRMDNGGGITFIANLADEVRRLKQVAVTDCCIYTI